MAKKLLGLGAALVITLALLAGCGSAQPEAAAPAPAPQTPTVSASGLQETGSLRISAGGQVLAEVPLEQLKQYPSARRKMTINSSQGATQHDFRGTLVSNILNDIDPTLVEKYTSIKTVGVDDYLSAISMDEVKQENNIYVMYSDADQPLLTKDGQPCGMRVVALDDQFGQRFTNYLVEIELE